MLLQIRRAEAGRLQTPAVSAPWHALLKHAGVADERLRLERL